MPDHVAIKFNSTLRRYEFTSLVWDVAEQQFVHPADYLPYDREYLFFQTRDVEQLVFDGQAGDDEIHADGGYKFALDDSEWGFSAGDRQQGARLIDVIIRGGAGNDRFFGGAGDDTIEGGSGVDVIQGHPGSDTLRGDEGVDLIEGYLATAPDRYEVTETTEGRNDVASRAARLREDFSSLLKTQASDVVVSGLSFDLGDTADWYLLATPTARNSFGEEIRAFLTQEMIQVQFKDTALGSFLQTLWDTELNKPLALYASSENGSVMVPVDQFSGVPNHYFLQVINPATRAVFGTSNAVGSWSPGTATFNLLIDGGAPGGATAAISIPADPNNGSATSARSLAKVANLINDSLQSQGLDTKVHAAAVADRLVFLLKDADRLEVTGLDENQPAYNYLFLRNGLSTQTALAAGKYDFILNNDLLGPTTAVPGDTGVRISSESPSDIPEPIPVGDINGDGYADFLAMRRQTSTAAITTNTYRIAFGSAQSQNLQLSADSPSIQVITPAGAVVRFASGNFNGDNVNNHGLSDIAVAVSGVSGFSPVVLVLLGRMTGWEGTRILDATTSTSFVADTDVVISGFASGSTLSVANAGNVNGAGGEELLVGDPAAGNGAGAIHVFDGSTWSRVRSRSLAADRSAGQPWTMTGLWHAHQWLGEAGYYFGIDASHNYDNGSRVAGALTVGNLTEPSLDATGLPAGVQFQIRFRYVLETERTVGYDTATLEWSTSSAGPWTNNRLASNQTAQPPILRLGDDSDWTTWDTLVSPAFASTGPVYVRFAFESTDAVSNSHQGWFITDVRLRTTAIQVLTNAAVRTFVGAAGDALGTSVAGLWHRNQRGEILTFDGDRFSDFAATGGTGSSPWVRVYRGADEPYANVAQQAALNLNAAFGAFSARTAGDLDGDGRSDLLLSGTSGSCLVQGTGLNTLTAIEVPALVLVPLGDINGDGCYDLGTSVYVDTDRLEGPGGLRHEIGLLYLGRTDAFDSANRYVRDNKPYLPDLVVEPQVPFFYSTILNMSTNALLVGVGNVDGSGPDDFVIKDSPAGRGLNLILGGAWIPNWPGAARTFLPANEFVFSSASPLPTVNTVPIPGIDLSDPDGSRDFSDAFGLSGSDRRRALIPVHECWRRQRRHVRGLSAHQLGQGLLAVWPRQSERSQGNRTALRRGL